MVDPAAQQAMNVEPPTFNRVGWQNMTADSNPAWANMTPEKQEQKLATVKAGGDLADSKEILPASRQCNDVCFILFFWALAGGMLVWSVINFGTVQTTLDAIFADFSLPPLPLGAIGVGAGAGGAAGMLGCAIFVYLMGSSPSCVVWGSLIMGPLMCICLGACLFFLDPLIGGVVAAGGLCSLFCVFFCLRSFVPFTIEVADCLADVVKENPSTVAIALVGGFFGMVWPLLVLFSAIATVPTFPDMSPQIIALPFVFILLWGASIGYFYTHTILCGVFGRWYYKKDQASPMCSSIKAATTTSLGSIAFAAFLVALVRTVQFGISMARENAQEEGGPVLIAVLCCLECLVACIADLIEWFSEWALVQVAIRGTSFTDSARITLTMATASNLLSIIVVLLIDSVANMAILICAVLSAVAGFGAVYLTSGDAVNADGTPATMTLGMVGLVMGLLPGLFIGSTAGSLVASGSKTVLMSWAEKPEVLAQLRPELALRFEKAASGADE